MKYRRGISDEVYNRWSSAIISRLMQLPEIQQASHIHCFWPIAENREINTIPLIKDLHAKGKDIILPAVVSFTEAELGLTRMEHRIYNGETNLISNRWGIMEPIDKGSFPIQALDAVIVPALGVDQKGTRIGYGKGFYDEFLAECDRPFICPTYSECLLDHLPTLPHDIPVDIIVTEQEVLRL